MGCKAWTQGSANAILLIACQLHFPNCRDKMQDARSAGCFESQVDKNVRILAKLLKSLDAEELGEQWTADMTVERNLITTEIQVAYSEACKRMGKQFFRSPLTLAEAHLAMMDAFTVMQEDRLMLHYWRRIYEQNLAWLKEQYSQVTELPQP